MDFAQELEARISGIEEIIKKYLPKAEGPQKTVIEAMNYAMAAGGKRLRPLLMQETYRLFGGDGEVVEPFMAAIEMVHNYSLIHDDLPALDNDDYRRGRKATHAVYGETIGILAGDGLLNYAFETAAKAFSMEVSDRTARAMKILADKAGIYGIVGGQCADVEAEGHEISFEILKFIDEAKTAALIEAAMMIGAVLAGADDAQLFSVEQAASDIGIAFQIQDDILDETSSTEVLGKPVGSDEKNHKNTWVSRMGLAASRAEVDRLSLEAESLLSSLPGSNAFLLDLVASLTRRVK